MKEICQKKEKGIEDALFPRIAHLGPFLILSIFKNINLGKYLISPNVATFYPLSFVTVLAHQEQKYLKFYCSGVKE